MISAHTKVVVGWMLILIGIAARDRTQILGGWQIVREASR